MKPIFWGIAVGIFQAFSPLAFWWLDPNLVWSLALILIAAVYIGFAVADGAGMLLRPRSGWQPGS